MTKQAKKTSTKTRAIVRKRAKSPKAKAEVVDLAKVKKGSVVPASFKAKAGREGIMRNDDLGTAIKDAFLGDESPRGAVEAILAANGLDTSRWEGRNRGMLRMNVTNVLRGLRRNGATVIVRGKKFGPVEA